ncbi:MAG TPA: phosphatase PAP2 family protein [Candidatus Magasanikbacteria bacterium]|nr:phosphatase PAP2 family protein [Candidatus Magasanikbacteria bacterium]
MKKSWSHTLFLRINASIGNKPHRDRFMIFCANILVFLMLVFAIVYGLYAWSQGNGSWLTQYLELFVITFLCAEFVSYLFAIVFKHPRPRIEFPESKQLIHTVGTWKSFPSDHTIGAFLLAGVLLLVPFTPVWLIVAMYMSAVFVSFSRVYVGVHYPRDIIGGFVVANLVLGFLPLVLYHIVEPFSFLW